MKTWKTTVSTLFLLLLIQTSLFAQYSLFVGEPAYLSVPDPPFNGWVTHASWDLDVDYMSISDYDQYGAIVKPRHYFEGSSTVSVHYYYSYYNANNTISVNNSMEYWTFTCNPIPFSLNRESLELKVGEKFTLFPSYPSSYAGWTSGLQYEWESTDDNIAEVSNNGTVTARYPGKARITLDPIMGPLCFCQVIVTADPPEQITLEPEHLFIVEGKSAHFSYSLTPKNSYSPVTWSSSNESIATVNNNGRVTAISEGKATITATTGNGLSASGTVEVIPLPTSVVLPAALRIPSGFSILLKPQFKPDNSQAECRWSSSDEGIATVDASGKVWAKKPGSAIITVKTSNGLSANCTVESYSPDNGLNKRSVQSRIQAIKSLITNTKEQLKNEK